ncbi:hypothetical protein BJ138DRAFT_1215573 [Hygrophoropsis aurantiaca]|uniref:Uncharacterized protein n=1 Tax=Hygrophoropsis aurantiaca TaxID=72124 RepID=A0ACB8A1T8_9AGAM|nr:hypothetical protein BJ138DRAFT_1215573 [Hygrophoropsis aurantiaca]
MLTLNNSIGAILVGAFVMMYLFGIVTVQTYHYYHKYPGDSLWLKILVASVWSLLLGHSIAVAIGLYTISVLNSGQFPTATVFNSRVPLGLASSILISAFIAPIAQGFFVYRVHVISKHRVIPALFCLVCLWQLVGNFGLGSYAIKYNDSLQHLMADFAWLIQGSIILGAVCDTLVAVMMCYYLRREKSIAITRTALILNRLMKYTIETGVLTSLTNLTVVICYVTIPTSLVWLAVFLIRAEVYANALLANLNARNPHPKNDKNEYASQRLAFLANIESRNSRLQRNLARLDPRHSKDVPDLVIPDYATDGISLTPSASPVQGIVIAVCQTKEVARDAHGGTEGHMHSVESFA